LLSDLTIYWTLYGDFILDAVLTVLYAVKIVAGFYKVQDEHIKRGVVGCVMCICDLFQISSGMFLPN